MANTVSAYTVADMFLRALGAPTTTPMKRAVAIWLRFESGGRITGNNPWNLHGGAPCKEADRVCIGPQYRTHAGQVGNRYAGPGDQNVAIFGTLKEGTDASAANLRRLAPSYGYGRVISEARQGDAIGFLVALQNSSWSAGHYGYSKLVSAFRGNFNYNTPMLLQSPGGGAPGGSPNPPGGPNEGGGGNTSPTYTLDGIIAAISRITGKGANDILTEADIRKIAAKYDAPELWYNELGKDFVGKKVSDLAKEMLKGGVRIPFISDTVDSIGDIANTLNDIVGQAGDIFLFALGLLIGGTLTVYGARMLLSTTGPAKPLQAELVLPEGGTVHSHLSRRS